MRLTGVRPAPGTTELLEVLDRVLGGGIVIAPSPIVALGLVPAAAATRVVVTAFETYLQHPDPELSFQRAHPMRPITRGSP